MLSYFPRNAFVNAWASKGYTVCINNDSSNSVGTVWPQNDMNSCSNASFVFVADILVMLFVLQQFTDLRQVKVSSQFFALYS